MRITRDRALRVFRLLEDIPRKYADLKGQFEEMALGGPGPYLPGSRGRLRARAHYYPDWSDEDFAWVLERLTPPTT